MGEYVLAIDDHSSVAANGAPRPNPTRIIAILNRNTLVKSGYRISPLSNVSTSVAAIPETMMTAFFFDTTARERRAALLADVLVRHSEPSANCRAEGRLDRASTFRFSIIAQGAL